MHPPGTPSAAPQTRHPSVAVGASLAAGECATPSSLGHPHAVTCTPLPMIGGGPPSIPGRSSLLRCLHSPPGLPHGPAPTSVPLWTAPHSTEWSSLADPVDQGFHCHGIIHHFSGLRPEVLEAPHNLAPPSKGRQLRRGIVHSGGKGTATPHNVPSNCTINLAPWPCTSRRLLVARIRAYHHPHPGRPVRPLRLGQRQGLLGTTACEVRPDIHHFLVCFLEKLC